MTPESRRSGSAWSLKDFPGMAAVCLLHAGEFYRDGSLTYRDAGECPCCCEPVVDAIARLRGQIGQARQDEARARRRAEEFEAELKVVLGR